MSKMYMIAKHLQVPRNPKRPQDGLTTNESFHIATKLKNKDMIESSIIIECSEQKVVTNRYSDKSFQELYTYFATHYGEFINKWIYAQNRK